MTWEFFTGFAQIIIRFFRNVLDDTDRLGIFIDRPARRGARHDRFHCAGLDAVAATMPGPRARGLRMERPGAAGRGRSNAGAQALQSA